MYPDQIIFLLCAGVILVSALLVVTSRNLIHAALWLVSALFGIAALFALLNANFLAVVQVVVYIGAIAILFLFAVMLTRKDLVERGPRMRKSWWIPALLGLLILAGLVFLIFAQPDVNRTAAAIPAGLDPVRALGSALVSPDAYVLPFEVSSILLLAALVGAVYVAVAKRS
jgi:NADH-quinone oxidoreductase subunit J